MISARETAPNKTDERGSVTYRTEDHLAVLFQMYGSVWRRVFPYCIVNIIIAFLVAYTEDFTGADLSFHDQGHTFMSIMVSFLVVTRGHIANQRYMESRKLLSDLMRSCRELVQHAVAFTRYENGRKAKMWRADISRRTCSLLRTVVSVLEYDTKNENVWQVSELTKSEKQALILSVGGSNERAPLVLSIFLRTSISSHVENLSEPLDVNKELKLLHCTSDFVSAYHGLMKLITTPFPFPLVQMTRTILFVWVYSLPFALSSDIDEIIPLMFAVFFVTYGFIGLEFVAMELDDPFGNDANDFDAMGLAKVVFDDICITIRDIDGNESATLLETVIDCPLRAQIESDVRNHERFTKVDSWKSSRNYGSDDEGTSPITMSPTTATIQSMFTRPYFNDGTSVYPNGLEIPATIDEISRSTSGSSTSNMRSSIERPANIANTERSISFGSQERNVRSSLLETTRRKSSEDSIEVFGTNESVMYDSKENKIIVKHKKSRNSREGVVADSEVDGQSLDPNTRIPAGADKPPIGKGHVRENSEEGFLEMLQRRKGTGDSVGSSASSRRRRRSVKQKPIGKGHVREHSEEDFLEMLQRRKGTGDSVGSSASSKKRSVKQRSRTRSDIADRNEIDRPMLDPNRPTTSKLRRTSGSSRHRRRHSRNISFGTQEKNVRSGLLEALRQRNDSEDSIEVFGTDETVKFDSRSSKITVKQKRKEVVNNSAESKLDKILFDPNQQMPNRLEELKGGGHKRNGSFGVQEINDKSSGYLTKQRNRIGSDNADFHEMERSMLDPNRPTTSSLKKPPGSAGHRRRHSRNTSFGSQEKYVQSGIFEALRQRTDSEENIEAFGTDETVKFGPKRKSSVEQKRKEGVKNSDESEVDRILVDPNHQMPGHHRRNNSFGMQEINERSSLLSATQRKDSYNSSEIYGSGESVQYDSRRDSFNVGQKA